MAADKDEKTVVPRFATAHEVLVTFFPAHAGHTVIQKMESRGFLDMKCSCGRLINITEEYCAARAACTFAEVLHGVRNVPVEH